jgi:flagellar basal body-associated protein FliL
MGKEKSDSEVESKVEKKKMSGGKKFCLGCGGLVVLIIIIVVIAGAGHKGSSTSTSSSGSTTATTANKEYKVGDVISLDNHTLTVNSVNKNYQTGNQFEKPQDSNNVFVTVNVTIANIGNDNSLSVNEFGFKLEDEAGVQRVPTFATVTNPLQSVELSKGGTTTGNIAFESKANSKTLKLHYSGGMFGGGEIIVAL